MISVRLKPEGITMRLNRIFLDAGPDVLREIGGFLQQKRGGTPGIKAFILARSSLLPGPKPRKITINPAGRHHNLGHIFDRVNTQYFDGKITARITWGKAPAGYGVRKRTLGSYRKNSRIIRIHPLLDSPRVPRYYIAYVVHHEMLHAAMHDAGECGPRRVHTREFRMREKMFKDYDRAVAWEKRRWGA